MPNQEHIEGWRLRMRLPEQGRSALLRTSGQASVPRKPRRRLGTCGKVGLADVVAYRVSAPRAAWHFNAYILPSACYMWAN